MNTFRVDRVSHLEYQKTVFPGGEVNIRVVHYNPQEKPYLIGRIKNSEDVMELMMLVDALRRLSKKKITLVLPYLPYARQDRVCNEGEALSIKVFANLINSLKFENVYVYDNHSGVGTALLDNCIDMSVLDIFKKYYSLIPRGTDYLISPDAGANKKVLELSKYYKVPMLRADKIRNTLTGEITGTEVFCGDMSDKSCLIVDDICDGGRTFIELEKALRKKNFKEVHLYVTHGIFSKGLEVLSKFNSITCTDSFYEGDSSNLNVINILNTI